MSSPREDVLESVSDPALREIARHGVVREASKGTILFREGDVGDTFGVILKGRVEIFLADDRNSKVIIAVREAGECFGEMSLETGLRRSASVACLSPSVFSMVTRKTLLKVIQDRPEIALFIVSTLIRRARMATELVRDLSLSDVYGRVARLLQEISHDRQEGGRVVAERLSQAEIARRVGASRDMVNRIFKALQSGGYLRIEEGLICLPQGHLPSRF